MKRTQATTPKNVVTPVKPTPTPEKPKETQIGYDLDKLAHAVAFAETGHCTDGTAIKRNNCFGIMSWDKNGNRYPRYFKSHEESFTEFKRIWVKYYGRFPDKKLADKWTGKDKPDSWLQNVTTYYNSH